MLRAALPRVHRAMGLAAVLLAPGCWSFPAADVRHSHAEVLLVTGARAVGAEGADDPGDYMTQTTGFSHVAAGDRVVLIVRDSDARAGWIDSGSGETLMVEVPSLLGATQWPVGEGSQVWFWRMTAWGVWVVRNIQGTVSVRLRGGSMYAIDIDIAGVRDLPALAREEVRLRHIFSATPIAFEEFRRRYPPPTGWTR